MAASFGSREGILALGVKATPDQDSRRVSNREIGGEMRKLAALAVTVLVSVTPAPAAQLRILFVGNSYTSVNDLPRTLGAIARSLGDLAETAMVAPGGYTLQQHSQDANTLAKIKAGPWDFVVLQEQSQMPELARDQVEDLILPWVLKLHQAVEIANPAARTVLFETWGKRDGDRQFCQVRPEVCTYRGMQDRIIATYRFLAERTAGVLAPVGEAWSEVRHTHPEIELYSNDGSHPSPQGTYLAACVFYAVLLGKTPAGADTLGIDRDQARHLQQVAEAVVLSGRIRRK
jgi:hypothetical protein